MVKYLRRLKCEGFKKTMLKILFLHTHQVELKIETELTHGTKIGIDKYDRMFIRKRFTQWD